jgi:hypothetical protein
MATANRMQSSTLKKSWIEVKDHISLNTKAIKTIQTNIQPDIKTAIAES